MKTILIVFILTVAAFSQQMTYSYGYDSSGDYYNETGFPLDSLSQADSARAVYFLLSDRYYAEVADSVLGVYFWYVNAASATDSVKFTIKSAWGMEGFTDGAYTYATEARRTLATVTAAGDTLGFTPIYSPVGLKFPPERLELYIEAVAAHDSGAVFLGRLAYPKVYQGKNITGNEQ